MKKLKLFTLIFSFLLISLQLWSQTPMSIDANGAINIGAEGQGNNFIVNGVNNAFVPRGAIMMWSGNPTALPSGWVLCNGQGTFKDQYGTIFSIPNLSGRFIVGYSPTQDPYKVNNTAGSKLPTDTTITLTTNELPPHSHTGTTNNDGNHSHDYGDIYFSESNGTVTTPDSAGLGANIDYDNKGFEMKRSTLVNTTSNHSHSFTTNNTGGENGAAKPFDIRPPYYVLAYIIKI